MTTTLTVPDITAPLKALTDWLAQPATKVQLQSAVSDAIAEADKYVLNNTSLRVPRQPAERQNGFRSWLDTFTSQGFENWLNIYKHKLAQDIQSEVLSAFPEMFSGVRNRQLVRETIETIVWPELEPVLRNRSEELLLTYAIRGIALAWASRHLGDHLLVGVPERRAVGWQAPLYLRATKAHVADVELDEDGEILSKIENLRAATATQT